MVIKKTMEAQVRHRVLELADKGLSVSVIAKRLAIGPAKVARILKEEGRVAGDGRAARWNVNP